jgi:hypothetical protein
LKERGVHEATTRKVVADSSPTKPSGGYKLIPVIQLAMAWWSYRQGLVRIADLRVWFAAQEMIARRCLVPKDLPCRFGLGELQKLVGMTPRRLRDSLRRLEAMRLLTWTESAICFPASPDILPVADLADFWQFLNQIPNARRQVPFPRRILRLVAGGARPALIATILGHLVRCLYLKDGKCLAQGRVKASWIASTFRVGLRRAKDARQNLITLGWLIPLESPQWALNRWGARVCINLAWSRTGTLEKPQVPESSVPRYPVLKGPCPTAFVPDPKVAPPPALSRPESAPPESHAKPQGSYRNQKPASGGLAGVQLPNANRPFINQAQSVIADDSTVVREAPPLRAHCQPVTESRQPRKPDLQNVLPEDLKDTSRLLALYGQAVAEGVVKASEADRLRFVTAAEHARVIGTKNACGLFIRLIRSRLWPFLTQDDEDSAQARLKRHFYGLGLSRSAGSGWETVEDVELSVDAQAVKAVQQAVVTSGYRGDAFPLLRRARPEWTRERWDRAVAELGTVAP